MERRSCGRLCDCEAVREVGYATAARFERDLALLTGRDSFARGLVQRDPLGSIESRRDGVALVTVLEAIQRSTEFLTRKGVESPRLQSELLLAHVLKIPRMRLYLDFERPVKEPELAAYRELVVRRGQREPLQHIVGTANFCGLELSVSRDVLVPRPETELLAEQGWQFLLKQGPSAAALDFGTGSGCLAIALGKRCPGAVVCAIDTSEAALAVARANAELHAVSDRVRFVNGNHLGAVPEPREFNLIISNPPYIPSAEIESLDPEVRGFDPRNALDGGADGLQFYRMLAAEASPRLAQGGRLMVEFGDGQANALREIFSAQKWIVEGVLEDYNQRPRILVAYPG